MPGRWCGDGMGGGMTRKGQERTFRGNGNILGES